ncbi:MAG: Succinate dehydrogenase, flavoprotein subunit [Acidobacteria bacterium]|nr:Succinate dehydrogenase, flavoprotein subunit [Acidobacteriota bacterium]
MTHLTSDVLIVGAGGAGMYAAVAAARHGASVLLLDKSLVGRGGATIMAQMTVAAALGHEEPDDWTVHAADTVEAGRGLCNEPLATLLCQQGPSRILEMDGWGARWARAGGRLKQSPAPGHTRRRCCYIDFLNTGPAVAAALRRQTSSSPRVQRLSNVAATDIVVRDGCAVGAVALDMVSGQGLTIDAKAVILAAGGLTKLYRRNSASANMGGEAYALALWAGAELVDMEFVQFFPIAHLAPRLVGMDPIMWDPFRYKLGGRLLNGHFEEFMHRYGGSDSGQYSTARDQASYAIVKEVEAGRGSPHGGVYLDFRHVAESELRGAFGPVIDRLLANGIDLTRMPVEVSPVAHYHMGGIRVNPRMQTCIEGLYAAGEAVGGAHGANRLSGNAITEAFVFGECAGRAAAEGAARRRHSGWDATAAASPLDRTRRLRDGRPHGALTPISLQTELQDLMWEHVGLFRTGAQLDAALSRIRQMSDGELPHVRIASAGQFNMDLHDWYELRAMLVVAEAVAAAAALRRESRGAHQRLDFPETDAALRSNQVIRLERGQLSIRHEPIIQAPSTAAHS